MEVNVKLNISWIPALIEIPPPPPPKSPLIEGLCPIGAPAWKVVQLSWQHEEGHKETEEQLKSTNETELKKIMSFPEF